MHLHAALPSAVSSEDVHTCNVADSPTREQAAALAFFVVVRHSRALVWLVPARPALTGPLFCNPLSVLVGFCPTGSKRRRRLTLGRRPVQRLRGVHANHDGHDNAKHDRHVDADEQRNVDADHDLDDNAYNIRYAVDAGTATQRACGMSSAPLRSRPMPCAPSAVNVPTHMESR